MNVLYGISIENETRLDDTSNYDTSYKVLDAFDYSSITTIDIKKDIYDLSVNVNGSYIALVENQSAYDSMQETFLKVYAVGAMKTDNQDDVSIEEGSLNYDDQFLMFFLQDDEEEDLQSEDDSSDSMSDIVVDDILNGNNGMRRLRRQIIDEIMNEDPNEDFEWVDSQDDSEDDSDDDDDEEMEVVNEENDDNNSMFDDDV